MIFKELCFWKIKTIIIIIIIIIIIKIMGIKKADGIFKDH